MTFWVNFMLDRVAQGAADGFKSYLAMEQGCIDDPPEDPLDASAVFLGAVFPRLWAANGLPRVEMSHRLCASLCATRLPEDLSVAELAPWSTHLIDVPAGIIPLAKDGMQRAGVGEWVRAIFVHVQDDAWRWIAFSDTNRGRIEEFGLDSSDMLKIESPKVARRLVNGVLEDFEESDEMARMGCAIGRLIVGTWLRVGGMRSSSGAPLGPPAAPKMKRGAPKAWTFRLVGDVKLDVRQAVVDYIRGGGKSPSVQSLVRGHWKRQRCGEAGTERRWIHVEPYWRGPEDAPIAVRSHVLTGATPPGKAGG